MTILWMDGWMTDRWLDGLIWLVTRSLDETSDVCVMYTKA